MKHLYDYGKGHQTANRYVNPNPAVRTGLLSLTNETPTGPAWFGSNNQTASGGGWVTDPAGNIQAVGGTARSFTWDAEDRQTSATVNGVTWTYVYDGLGQRVRKTGNGAATTFVYDAEGKLAAEYQPAGQTPAVCATATCYITADHLGSTRMITDSSGNVAARYDYLPFGTELQAGTGGRLTSMEYTLSPDGFLMKFTGQVRDQESGLDYMHARMYSPAQGRFTGVDPGNAGADMGNGQSWNGYAYVGNNPLTVTDPSGMDAAGALIGCSIGPWGCVAGVAADIIGALFGLGALGGGGGAPPYANFPFPNQSQSATPWNEQLPAGVQFGGGVNIGGVFGSGNTSPFVFSLQPGSQPSSILDNISDLAAGAGDALTTIPFTSIRLIDWVRKHTPGGDPTNSSSVFYKSGEVIGASVGVALTAGGGATAAAIADGKSGAYFGRGTATVFNSGKVRFGWYWAVNKDAIGLRIGAARGTSWYSHIPFWYPR